MRESAAIYSTRFVSRRRMQQVGCEDSREGIVVLVINSMNALSNVSRIFNGVYLKFYTGKLFLFQAFTWLLNAIEFLFEIFIRFSI